MIELLIAAVIVFVVASMAYPPIASVVSSARAENAARVVAGDLRHAVTLASRQGTPVRVQVDAESSELRLLDRRSGAVLHRRTLGSGTELPIASLSASPATVDVFPNRITSGPLTVTLVTPKRTTQVSMTRTALVRVVEP